MESPPTRWEPGTAADDDSLYILTDQLELSVGQELCAYTYGFLGLFDSSDQLTQLV
jgi:hypothetical protein